MSSDDLSWWKLTPPRKDTDIIPGLMDGMYGSVGTAVCGQLVFMKPANGYASPAAFLVRTVRAEWTWKAI